MAVMRIVVLVGLPGSGKSTWLARQGAPTLSSDEVRRLLADDPTNQSIHGCVFRTLRYLLKERLAIGRPVTYIDATHLTRRGRLPYIRLGERFGCEVEAVFFDTPIEVCQERNRLRERVVPQDVIERMARKMTPPSREEGFSRVTVVRE
jgi:predicted kinase